MTSQRGTKGNNGFLKINLNPYHKLTVRLTKKAITKPITMISEIISPPIGWLIHRMPTEAKKQILQINATLDRNLNADINCFLQTKESNGQPAGVQNTRLEGSGME